jgi:chromosome segregation ATPase
MNNTPMTIEDSDEFPVMTFPSGDHPLVVRAEVARQLKRELREWEMLRSWGGTPAHVEAFIRGQQDRIHAAQDVERELAAAKREVEELSRSIRQQQLMDEEILGLRERNAELQRSLDETATKLMHAVNDRNSLGNQIDLLRDEFMRIRARIGETGLAETHCELRSIADYCERAQQDIAICYSVIEHRDQLERKSTRLLIELSDANERIRRLEEAGDAVADGLRTIVRCDMHCLENWTKAKGTRP